MSASWFSALLDRASPAVHAALARAGVAERLAPELAAARARWPEATTTIDDDRLATVIAERLATQDDPQAAVERLRIDDLLLAQWCASGDARAITAFEHVHQAELSAVFARFRKLAMSDDEMRQALRIKLFVGAPSTGHPRIADYSGFGFLQNWVRVTALRMLVDLARSEQSRQLEELLPEDDLLSGDLEIDSRYTRAQITAAIKRAFAAAVAGLAPRQRNFLRHTHVDHLTLDQIATLYSVHRATVARTLAQARADITTATRRELGAQLGLDDDQLESLVRAADSRIDLSLSRVLDAPVPS